MKENNLTEEEIDFMWDFCKEFNHRTIKFLRDWRLLRPDLVSQISIEYEKMVKKVLYEDGENERSRDD